MRGYTDTDLIAAELGAELTDAQLQYAADTLIGQAEALINRSIKRAFLSGGAVVDEPHDEPSALPRVAYYPFDAVQAVGGRFDERLPYQSLMLGTDWEVADPEHGLIRLFGQGHHRRRYDRGDGYGGWWDPVYAGRGRAGRPYDRILVSYTPTDALEMVSDAALLVQRAATILVAGWLSASAGGMAGQAGDIKSYSIPGDMAVTFRDPPPGRQLPADVLALLAPLMPVVLFG